MPNFDGLAFPVITVRLGNHRGNGTMKTYSDAVRASLTYSYSEPDGEPFAARVAQAVWDKYVTQSESGEFPYTPSPVVLVPGNPGSNSGYVFVAVPESYFAN